MNEFVQTIYDAILNGDKAQTPQAVQAGLDPATLLTDGMVAAMREVGKRFEDGDFYVPEMLISAHAMRAGLAVLKPELVKGNVQSAGKVAIATVKGDLHDIGKNLVKMMLEGSGFEVLDLGVLWGRQMERNLRSLFLIFAGFGIVKLWSIGVLQTGLQ
jgi:5-methyltetrahydrofolate--homocysteine methyltransferase